MADAGPTCRICGAAELHEFPEFADLPRVTSDCKAFAPGGRLAMCNACGAAQTLIDDRWLSDIDKIYSNYEPYFQSGGVEQAVFDAARGVPRLRSDVILDKLDGSVGLGGDGTMIDVGCGNGVMLKAFARRRAQWHLHGHELSDLHEAELKAIPGFVKLHTGDLATLEGRYDLITMMHALEHFIDPLQAVVDLRSRLKAEGALFIEVPNGAATPFDLLIADHVSHFTRHDLARLFGRAGAGADAVADDWITKELSAIVRPTGAVVAIPGEQTPRAAKARIESQLRWLRSIITGAKQAAREGRSFGIFGSSVAAMWLFGAIGDDVEFFVDEDPNRCGADLHGRKILAPGDVPGGSTVYMTLIPQVAAAVAGRLGRPGVDFRAPPAVG